MTEIEPTAILAKTLIFVSIQSNDNYHSQSLMEAMACGCACVVSDVGETRKLITGDTGVIVLLDARSIADGILKLLRDREYALSLGINAREKVIAEQSIQRYAEYVENLYQKASARAVT